MASIHRKSAGKTPPFCDAGGDILPGSIAEAAYLRLGRFDQWVLIRGESVENPVLIVLSGGPGFSDTPFLRHYNAALEKAFVMVYWDQRGAGRSYDPDIPLSTMTTERFIADLDELVDCVRDRFGRRKVAIMGHSWGTVLGGLYVGRFPDKVSVYVGCAQIGDWAKAEAGSYALVLAEAEARGNAKAIRELRGIGPPPYSADALWTERMWSQKLEGNMGLPALWTIARIFLFGPESSLLDSAKIMKGFRFSLDAMWADVSKLNLIELAPVLNVPVFFLLGRRDQWVPPETSLAYFDALVAPSKQVVWFEDSAHEAFVDEPEKFDRIMTEVVRPVAAGP